MHKSCDVNQRGLGYNMGGLQSTAYETGERLAVVDVDRVGEKEGGEAEGPDGMSHLVIMGTHLDPKLTID